MSALIDPESLRTQFLVALMLIAGVDLAVAFIIRAQRESVPDDDR